MEAGIKGIKETLVTEENSAQAMGSGLLPVYATPAMVALMKEQHKQHCRCDILRHIQHHQYS